MTGAIQHTRLIQDAENYARTTLENYEFSGTLGASGASRAPFQKEFKDLLKLALRRFDVLMKDLACWREKVTSGEIDFELAREDGLKTGIRAFINLSDLLTDKFKEIHTATKSFVANPRHVGLLQSNRQDAQKILDSWQSPEWEVINPRVVHWNQEQSKQLLERLASG